MELTSEKKAVLLKAQQGEMNGVETYLMLAETVHNETDTATFRKLAAEEGRHAAVFRRYTGETLAPKKGQAYFVKAMYHLIGKRLLYPLIAQGEYAAISGYEQMIQEYPEVESVKNDEKRHGDTVKALLDNGEYRDWPKLPLVIGGLLFFLLCRQLCKDRD